MLYKIYSYVRKYLKVPHNRFRKYIPSIKLLMFVFCCQFCKCVIYKTNTVNINIYSTYILIPVYM